MTALILLLLKPTLLTSTLTLSWKGADWFHWSGITPAISDKAAELTRLACEAAKTSGVNCFC